MVIIGYFDGACEPRNPGGAMGFGALLTENGEVIWQNSGMAPAAKTNSNNVAEYAALIMLLDHLIAEGMTAREIEVCGDSQLVIKQMMGIWRISQNSNGLYVPMGRKALALRPKFSRLRFKWIPREQNTLADDLSKQELATDDEHDDLDSETAVRLAAIKN
jgi:ribonuclease HI